jgi:predicted Zn-dependent protease
MNSGLGAMIAALLVTGLLVQSCAGSASAICHGEAEKAQRTRDRIENELPLRGSDSVTDYMRAFGWHLAERAGIADDAPWRFAVVRDRSVNAFSIGDGRIYVTEGAILAAENQDEFAGVIAHEMGHQLAGHFCPQAQARGSPSAGHGSAGASSQLGSLRQGMDPAKEREADDLAVRILRDAGYDPAARSRVISRSRSAPVDGDRPAAAAGQRHGTAATRGPSPLARAQETLLQER